MNNCQRCYQPMICSQMSVFNTQTICPECKQKETNHRDYNKAVLAEQEQVQQGNYNFRGIGKPIDL